MVRLHSFPWSWYRLRDQCLCLEAMSRRLQNSDLQYCVRKVYYVYFSLSAFYIITLLCLQLPFHQFLKDLPSPLMLYLQRYGFPVVHSSIQVVTPLSFACKYRQCYQYSSCKEYCCCCCCCTGMCQGDVVSQTPHRAD